MSLQDEIARLLKEGRKLEAIKVYRETTGSSLANAKIMVEQMEATLKSVAKAKPTANADMSNTGLLKDISNLLARGLVNEAIDHFCRVTGRSYDEAKFEIEEYAKRFAPQAPARGKVQASTPAKVQTPATAKQSVQKPPRQPVPLKALDNVSNNVTPDIPLDNSKAILLMLTLLLGLGAFIIAYFLDLL